MNFFRFVFHQFQSDLVRCVGLAITVFLACCDIVSSLFQIDKYDRVVLIAGGIGITGVLPYWSYLSSLFKDSDHQRVTLLWFVFHAYQKTNFMY